MAGRGSGRIGLVALGLIVIGLQTVIMVHLRGCLVAPQPQPISEPRNSAATPQNTDVLSSVLHENLKTPVPTTALPLSNLPTSTSTIPASLGFNVIINVFTYNRVVGLRRLLRSLADADYLNEGSAGRRAIELRIFVDYPKSGSGDKRTAEVRSFLSREFQWPHGPLRVHRREMNAGLKRSIMEAWYPSDNSEVAAFFEDDIEVAPLWFAWVRQALNAYAPGGKPVDEKLFGLSLFRPIHDELSGRKCTVDNGNKPFVLQQPCSWGAVFFPKPWRLFRDWYQSHSERTAELVDPNDPDVNPSSNTWDSKSSWKKFLIKLMYQQGQFMVYPNHPNNMVLSTNHLMKGEHPTPPKALFELPLLALGGKTYSELDDAARVATFSFPPLEKLMAFDVMFRPTPSRTVLTLPNYKVPLLDANDS